MLKQELNEQLTQVGPGTPMGELLRRYWYPVAFVRELDEWPIKKVRLLGENFALWKQPSGRYGIMQELCPHRRASMVYGVVEEEDHVRSRGDLQESDRLKCCISNCHCVRRSMGRACYWMTRSKAQDVFENSVCTAVILVEAVVHRIGIVNLARRNERDSTLAHSSPNNVDSPAKHAPGHRFRPSGEADLVQALWRGVFCKHTAFLFGERAAETPAE